LTDWSCARLVPDGQAATGVTHPDSSLEALLAVLLVVRS